MVVLLVHGSAALAEGRWTGFYMGLQTGLASSVGKTNLEGLENGVVNLPGGAWDSPEFDEILDGKPIAASGGLFGVKAGYNHQIENLVLGFDADVNLSGINNSYTRVEGIAFGDTLTFNQSFEMDWLATAKLRAGYSAGTTLFYITGGFASGEVDIKNALAFDLGGPNEVIYAGQSKERKMGWAIGGGIEHPLSDTLSLTGEYLYVDLKDSAMQGSISPNNVTVQTRLTSPNTANMFKIGVNWKF
jgi:outer membrane immunogenic protein